MTRPAAGVRSLLASIALLAACSTAKDDSREQIDSALARDLELASSPVRPSADVAFGDTALNPSGGGRSSSASQTSASKAAPRAPSAAPVERPRVTARPQAPRRSEPAPKPVETTASPKEEPVQVVQAPIVTPTPATGERPTTSGSGSSTAGRARGIGTGATLAGLTTQEICSPANRPGDRFVVSLSNDVIGADDAVLPAGTPVLIELASTPADGPFGFRVKSVQVAGDLVAVQGSVRSDGKMTERRISDGNDKAKVIGGAVAGAILGKVLGGGTKGAVVGAAAGGAAGTIAASRSGKVERCLPAGSAITVTLSSPLVLASGTQ